MNGTHAEPPLGRSKGWLSPSGTTILEAHYHFVGHRHFLQSMAVIAARRARHRENLIEVNEFAVAFGFTATRGEQIAVARVGGSP